MFRCVCVCVCYGSGEMSRFIDRFVLHDGQRIQASKEVLLQHLSAERTLLMNKLSLVDKAIEAVDNVDFEKDVKEFVNASLELQSNESGKREMNGIDN